MHMSNIRTILGVILEHIGMDLRSYNQTGMGMDINNTFTSLSWLAYLYFFCVNMRRKKDFLPGRNSN